MARYFTIFILCFLGWIQVSFLHAQDTYTRDDRDVIFQIYLGEVRVGEADKMFRHVKEWGFFRPFSISNMPTQQMVMRAPRTEKIYIGPYLGFETVSHMLQKLRTMGFEKAQIEGNEITLTSERGRYLTHTVQLGAFQTPRAHLFTHLAYLPAYGIYIVYENGLYKIFSGLYTEEQQTYVEETVIPYWRDKWGFKPFLEALRQTYQEEPKICLENSAIWKRRK